MIEAILSGVISNIISNLVLSKLEIPDNGPRISEKDIDDVKNKRDDATLEDLHKYYLYGVQYYKEGSYNNAKQYTWLAIKKVRLHSGINTKTLEILKDYYKILSCIYKDSDRDKKSIQIFIIYNKLCLFFENKTKINKNEIIEYNYNLSALYIEIQKYKQATEYIDTAIDLYEDNHERDNHKHIFLLTNILIKQKEYNTARDTLETTQDILANKNTHAEDVAEYHILKAIIYRSLYEFEEAIKELNKTNNIESIALSTQTINNIEDLMEETNNIYLFINKFKYIQDTQTANETAISLGNNALKLQEKGEYKDALFVMHQCIYILEKILGRIDINLATSYNNISMIYQAMGELEKALEYQEKALKLTEEVLGEKHPDLATSYNNISLIYQDMGELEKALEYQEKALKLREEILGEKHPSLATSYNNISLIYEAMGELEKAKMYINKAIEILKYVFPNGHPNLDVLLQNKKNINI